MKEMNELEQELLRLEAKINDRKKFHEAVAAFNKVGSDLSDLKLNIVKGILGVLIGPNDPEVAILIEPDDPEGIRTKKVIARVTNILVKIAKKQKLAPGEEETIEKLEKAMPGFIDNLINFLRGKINIKDIFKTSVLETIRTQEPELHSQIIEFDSLAQQKRDELARLKNEIERYKKQLKDEPRNLLELETRKNEVKEIIVQLSEIAKPNFINKGLVQHLNDIAGTCRSYMSFKQLGFNPFGSSRTATKAMVSQLKQSLEAFQANLQKLGMDDWELLNRLEMANPSLKENIMKTMKDIQPVLKAMDTMPRFSPWANHKDVVSINLLFKRTGLDRVVDRIMPEMKPEPVSQKPTVPPPSEDRNAKDKHPQ